MFVAFTATVLASAALGAYLAGVPEVQAAAASFWAVVEQQAGQLEPWMVAYAAIAVTAAVIVVVLVAMTSSMHVPDVDVDLDLHPVLFPKDKKHYGSHEMAPLQGSDPTTIHCFNPSTGQKLGIVRVDTPDDVKDVVDRARAAQAKWADTSFEERRTVMRIIAKAVHRYRDDICKLAAAETGKSLLDCTFGEILVTLEKAQWVCAEGEEALKPEFRRPGAVIASKSCRVEYHPLGVMGVIAPWNYPFHNMYNHIISCIFAGNGIVLKMSEFSCFTVDRMLRIARTALASRGHNPDLVGAVNGFAATGRAVVALTDKVIFTGSPGVGRLVMESASKSLTPVVLELGGKDPVVVCEDANVDDVLPIILRGTFQGAGQNCIGIERVLAYESIYDELVDKAEAAVKALRQGPPLNDKGEWNEVDMGANTTAAQADHILELVDDAVKHGAVLHCGGKMNEAARTAAGGGGVYVQPTMLSNVTKDMRIFQEEVFGPVLCVIKVELNSDVEAKRLCNAVQYGLGSNVYSKDIPRAERLGSQIRAGMTNVNDMALNYMAQSLPFGGVKNSGFGRFAGVEGLRECCLLKSVTSGKPTILPKALQYPVSDGSHRFIGGMMDSFYGTSMMQRSAGVAAMMAELGPSGILEQM